MKRALWLALAATLLASCGSGDGDQGDRADTVPTSGLARFESPRIPFTFDYRKGVFRRIEARRTSSSELRPKRYLDAFQRDLERSGRAVATREQKIGDREVGVLDVRGPDVTSLSYFFTGAGKTWQIECIADDADRAEIEAACRAALESVDFRR